MRVAVFGPNGQLGTDVCKVASATLGDVVKITRADIDLITAAPGHLYSFLAALDFDVLINCTAYHDLTLCHNHPSLAMKVNGHMVGVMAMVCRDQGRRFIHISTDYVFGGDQPDEKQHGYRESEAPSPVNVYGASKLLGEKLAIRHGANLVTVVRVAGLFGSTPPSGKKHNFVDMVIAKMKAGEHITMADDQTTSPTYTWDAARAISRIVRNIRFVQGGVVHVCNGAKLTWYEWALMIGKQIPGVTGYRLEPKMTEEIIGGIVRPQYSALSNLNLHCDWGIKIPGSLEDSLQSYLLEKYST